MTNLPQLICLPPAGAGPSLFYPWTQRYRDQLTIFPVPLPGRETRIADPLPDSLDQLADQLADELAPCLARSYALFGYSMGAALAYGISRRWARRGLPKPEMLFILSCNPPDRLLDDRAPLHELESDAFWDAIIDIGGTPREILEFPETKTVFEPILRNDFRLCETYEHRHDGPLLDCPTHAFVADDDHMVAAETAEGWRDFVVGDFTMHRLRGKHMLEKPAFEAMLDTVLSLWLRGSQTPIVGVA